MTEDQQRVMDAMGDFVAMMSKISRPAVTRQEVACATGEFRAKHFPEHVDEHTRLTGNTPPNYG